RRRRRCKVFDTSSPRATTNGRSAMTRLDSMLRTTVLLLVSLAGPAAASGPTEDERELRRIKEELWPRACREGDVALLDRLLAAEFQVIDAEGGRSDKAAELAFAAGRRWINRSFRFEIDRL